MAYLFLLVGAALLFVVSAVNAMAGFYDEAFSYGLAGFLLVFFTAIYLLKIKQANEYLSRDKLVEWIIQNEEYILAGEMSYHGLIVTRKTVLVKYCIVYSAIFFTRKDFTNYCVKGSSRSVVVGVGSTVFNLMMGWWGLPWGPIYTPQSIYINTLKTASITVANLLEAQAKPSSVEAGAY